MRFHVISSLVISIILTNSLIVNAQTLQGRITSNGIEVPFANIIIEESGSGVSSNENGYYKFEKLENGYQHLIVTSLGQAKKELRINIKDGQNIINVDLKYWQ